MKTFYIEDFYVNFKTSLELNLVTSENTIKEKKIENKGISFPGLVLTGFFKDYNSEEVQIIGKKEIQYILSLIESGLFYSKIREMFLDDIPCIIITDNQIIPNELIILANENNIPIICTNLSHYNFIKQFIQILELHFIESFYIFGTLLEVFGLGILLYGNEGIGKSETALAMVSRGHKFIADDKFLVKNFSNRLVGYANQKKFILKTGGFGHFEIDKMYGIEHVVIDKSIDLVISLVKEEEILKDKKEEKVDSMKIRGVSVPKFNIPIATGKNTQIMIEAVVKDFLYKKLLEQ